MVFEDTEFLSILAGHPSEAESGGGGLGCSATPGCCLIERGKMRGYERRSSL